MRPILSLQFFFISVIGIMIYSGSKYDLELPKCILLAMGNRSEENHVLFTKTTTENLEDDSAIDHILRKLSEKSIKTITKVNVEDLAETYNYYSVQYKVYVVFFKNLPEIEIILEKLENSYWNPRAKFLVISSNKFRNNSNIARTVFNSLLKYKVLDTTVILIDHSVSQNWTLFTWNPCQKPNCANRVKTIIKSTCSKEDFQSPDSWYRNQSCCLLKSGSIKVGVLNLGNQTLVWDNMTSIQSFKYFEVTLVDIVAKFLNLNVSLREIKVKIPGCVHPNHTITGAFEHLKNDTVDVLVGGYSLTPPRYIYLDASRPYIFDSLIWCVPYIPIFTKFKDMFNIIQPTTWLLVLCVYFLNAFLTWYSSSLQPTEDRSYKKISSILLYQIAMVLTVSVDKLPKTFQLRYLVMIFIIFSFYLAVLYQTQMISILADNNHVQKYETHMDIYRYNLKTYFSHNSLRFFTDNDVVKKKYIDCKDFFKCAEYVAVRKDSAFCTSKIRIYSAIPYLTSTRAPLIHCFKENVVRYPISIYMKKGSSLHGHINKIIDILTDIGIISKIKEIILKPYEQAAVTIVSEDTLKYESLVPCFAILLIGNCVAFCVFLLEVIVYRITPTVSIF